MPHHEKRRDVSPPFSTIIEGDLYPLFHHCVELNVNRMECANDVEPVVILIPIGTNSTANAKGVALM